MLSSGVRSLLLAVSLAYPIWAVDTWCGKPYEAGSPHITIPADSYFPIPAKSDKPLLNFRCNPVLRPYVSGEDSTGEIIIDAEITHDVGQPYPGAGSDAGLLAVAVESSGTILAAGAVLVGTKGTVLSFALKLLGKTRATPYNITCTARLGHATFSASTLVHYLPPNPSGGTVTKTDLRTGGLLVKRPGSGAYDPFFPYGFYTSTHQLTSQALVADIKAKGYNVIHSVPPFDNATAQNDALDYIDNAGLYLIYDMRHDYTNLTAVQEQVLAVKDRASLLLWYTADEPDGQEDALTSPGLASDLIHSIDPYHPVSLVLNCYDYYYTEYSARTDVILQDAYPIGMNATWSFRGTECTKTYGDCGCDDCTDETGLSDIGRRIDVLRDRARIQGVDRSTSVWSVPQAFGPQLYWPRWPTGLEFVAESATSILHGSKGVVAWLLPNTDDIYESGGVFAKTLSDIAPLILSPVAIYTFSTNPDHTLEAGLWSTPSERALLVTNIQNTTATITVHLAGYSGWKLVFESGTDASFKEAFGEAAITLQAFGTVVYVS